MEWTDELIARLRELWEQGLSTAEIGRQLSITKNAVVGKAHRLNLPSRPSPIRNKAAAEGGAKSTPRPRASRAKKPAEGDVTEAKEKGKKVAPGPATVEASKVEKPKKSVKAQQELPSAPAKKTAKPAQEVAEAPQAVSAPPRKVTPPRRVREAMDRSIRQGPTCQWPHGDPGTPEFHFCGATPLAGKPYCAEHAAIAYVKIRDRRH
ncbi:GcrA family cell cycle regulator [Bombella saccharophila]|uniref:GcrA cell cycle regulator n=1 Tax=Bombella saccharophila TaxID=2967338 RepID=A0ABT3W734_9PROT|nr:GcrA family cell cycle regulator [Bombella saccharophila]MCX5614890.1 GcrA cell cycle regulator [Bombella saccharophila]